MLNDRNIDQNNRDFDFCQNRAALFKVVNLRERKQRYSLRLKVVNLKIKIKKTYKFT